MIYRSGLIGPSLARYFQRRLDESIAGPPAFVFRQRITQPHTRKVVKLVARTEAECQVVGVAEADRSPASVCASQGGA